MNSNKVNIFLLITSVLSTLILVIGATFSYFTATSMSDVDALAVSAGKISLGLGISAENTGHLLIPLRDEDIELAYAQKCVDDFGMGACLSYTLELFNYNTAVNVEGRIDFTITDIENLSYMVLDENGNRYLDVTHVDKNNSTGLTLGNDFTIASGSEAMATSKKFTLLIWLSNLEGDQTEDDAAGNFEAVVSYNSTYNGRLTATVKGMESEVQQTSVIE